MKKIKETRYYELLNDIYYIYDNYYIKYSKSVSIVNDLEYYKKTFKLESVKDENRQNIEYV